MRNRPRLDKKAAEQKTLDRLRTLSVFRSTMPSDVADQIDSEILDLTVRLDQAA